MEFNGRAYYIVRVDNLASIAGQGILSYNQCRDANILHTSFALNDVQERRDGKIVTNGRPLHEYVPTYLNPRNATLYSLKDRPYFNDLCILVLDAEALLQVEGVVIADRNAATDYVAFLQPIEISTLDFNRIYATSWNHPDRLEKSRHKAEMCAEILVPDRIDPQHILGILSQSDAMSAVINDMALGFKVKVHKSKFFQ